MSQLIFKFPFKTKYYEQDFYVSSNNFPAYKLIESWPKWPGKWLNIFGAHGSGKTHLSKILEKKIKRTKIVDEKNLRSRTDSFLFIGIDLPTDDLLKVIISKSFSDKQINIDPKITEYIIKNIDRSYEKISEFLKDIDEFSLSSGKSININLIKKVLEK